MSFQISNGESGNKIWFLPQRRLVVTSQILDLIEGILRVTLVSGSPNFLYIPEQSRVSYVNGVKNADSTPAISSRHSPRPGNVG